MLLEPDQLDNCLDSSYFDVCLHSVGQAKDNDAFVEVFYFYAGKIKTYLVRKGITDNAAEEMTKDVMLEVLRLSGDYDPTRATASTYIFSIVRDHLLAYKRGYPRIEVEHADAMLEHGSG